MVWHCPCLLGTHTPGVVVAVTLEDRLRLGASLGWGKGPEGWRSVWMRKEDSSCVDGMQGCA